MQNTQLTQFWNKFLHYYSYQICRSSISQTWFFLKIHASHRQFSSLAAGSYFLKQSAKRKWKCELIIFLGFIDTIRKKSKKRNLQVGCPFKPCEEINKNQGDIGPVVRKLGNFIIPWVDVLKYLKLRPENDMEM